MDIHKRERCVGNVSQKVHHAVAAVTDTGHLNPCLDNIRQYTQMQIGTDHGDRHTDCRLPTVAITLQTCSNIKIFHLTHKSKRCTGHQVFKIDDVPLVGKVHNRVFQLAVDLGTGIIGLITKDHILVEGFTATVICLVVSERKVVVPQSGINFDDGVRFPVKPNIIFQIEF